MKRKLNYIKELILQGYKAHSKWINLIAKILVSSIILYYVFNKIKFADILEAIKNASIPYLILALVLYASSTMVASFRLYRLLIKIPINIGRRINVKLYWLGMFYNIFLPGGVGGDGYKIYLIHKYFKTPVKRTIGVLLSDRVSGLSVMVFMLLLLFQFINFSFPYKEWFWFALPFPFIGFFLFLLIFNRSLTGGFTAVSLWSILSQSLQLLASFCILKALGENNPTIIDDYLFLFLVSGITASIPISLGGIGLRETTFLWGAQYLALNSNTAVALSLIFYFTSILVALPGIIYSFDPHALFEGKDLEVNENSLQTSN